MVAGVNPKRAANLAWLRPARSERPAAVLFGARLLAFGLDCFGMALLPPVVFGNDRGDCFARSLFLGGGQVGFLVLGVDVERVKRDRFVVVVVDHSRPTGLPSSGKCPSEFPDPASLGHDHPNCRVGGEVDNQGHAFRLANPDPGSACQEGLGLHYRYRAVHRSHSVTMLRYTRIPVKRMTAEQPSRLKARGPIQRGPFGRDAWLSLEE